MEMNHFEFKCSRCDEIHKGIPGFSSQAPIYYYGIPEKERANRIKLTDDTCILDSKDFFVKGCLEIPVEGADEPFVFSSWISLSERSFLRFLDLFELDDRENEEPMAGWYSSWLWEFESTEKLKARIHFRNNGIRPLIELEPTEHPLAIAQRKGFSQHDIVSIFEYYTFGKKL
jgi:hypothetical protein